MGILSSHTKEELEKVYRDWPEEATHAAFTSEEGWVEGDGICEYSSLIGGEFETLDGSCSFLEEWTQYTKEEVSRKIESMQEVGESKKPLNLQGTFIRNDFGKLRDMWVEEGLKQGASWYGRTKQEVLEKEILFIDSEWDFDGLSNSEDLLGERFSFLKEITLEHFNKKEVEEVKIKPPLGLVPLSIYKQQCEQRRIVEILAAMERYSKEGLPVPLEWINELSLLISEED